MKKFFTLIAAVMMTVCASAVTTLNSSFNSWDASTCTVDGTSITYSSAWAGAGYWLSQMDLSSCDYIWVTCEKGSTVNLKMVIQYGSACAGGASGTSETTVDAGALIIGAKLDPAQKSSVAQFFLQSTNTGSVKITGCYAGTAEEYAAAEAATSIKYTTPVALTYDEYGQVLASAFNGYSDDAKIEFTYTVTGANGYVGWGAGTIKSLDGKVEYGTYAIGVKQEGDNVLTLTLGQIKDLLNAGPSEYGQYGICFNVWGFDDGKCTVERKSLTISEVEGFSGEGYKAPVTKDPLYVIGNINGKNGDGWTPNAAVATLDYDAANDVYTGTISVDNNWEGNGWFGISSTLGTTADDWTGFNAGRLSVSTNWGVLDTETALQAVGTDASFQFAEGTYTVTISLTKNTVIVTKAADAIQVVSINPANKVVKSIKNGRIVISARGAEYNVAGQLVK